MTRTQQLNDQIDKLKARNAELEDAVDKARLALNVYTKTGMGDLFELLDMLKEVQ